MNYDELLEIGLTPNQLFIYNCIKDKEIELLYKLRDIEPDKFTHDVWVLWRKSYIGPENLEEKTFEINKLYISNILGSSTDIHFEQVTKEEDKTKETKDNIEIKVKQHKFWYRDKEEFDNYFQIWYSLWPEKQKAGSGEYVKGDEIETKKRLLAHLELYNPDKERLLNCTKSYLKSQKSKNYSYCKTSYYFILKQGFGSTLRSEYTNYTDNNDKSSVFSNDI